MEHNYTEEQVKDITTREKDAIEYLKKNNLSPAAVISKTKLQTENGSEVFADQLTPYLQDTKYIIKTDGTYEERIVSTETNAKED